MKNEITISDRIKVLKDNGIIIYPKFNLRHQFAVAIEDEYNLLYKKKLTVGEYKHTTKTINDALTIALETLHKKINSPTS